MSDVSLTQVREGVHTCLLWVLWVAKDERLAGNAVVGVQKRVREEIKLLLFE